METRQVAQVSGGRRPVQLVDGEIEMRQGAQVAQRRGDGSGQSVVGEIETRQVAQVAQRSGDGSGQFVGWRDRDPSGR